MLVVTMSVLGAFPQIFGDVGGARLCGCRPGLMQVWFEDV